MVRTATKRKSEGDIPNKRKKQKATASTSAKNDGDSQEQDASSEGLFVEQLAPVYVKKDRPKARKSAPMHRIDDEYFEDEGRMESQQFIALVDLQMKKKRMAAKSSGDFTEKFQASIQNEEQALKTRLKELCVVATNEDKDFLKTFTRAYNSSRPANPPKSALAPAQPSELYFSTLYPRTRHLVESARSIVEQFVAMSDATAKLEASGGLLQQVADWEMENASLGQLMAVGHKVGVAKVEAMLDGKEGPELEEGDGRLVDLLYGIGEDGKKGDMGLGDGIVWGRLVKKQFKAEKRLYRTTVGAVGG